MAKVLGRHPRLFMPGETHFFDDVYASRATLGDLSSPVSRESVATKLSDHYRRYWEMPDQERIDAIIRDRPDVWARWRDGMRDYRDALSGFMSMQMEVEGKVRWGNNVPRDIFNLNEILDFYPQAKFVVCARDPRDFLLSYKGKWKVTDGEHISRLRQLYHPVITSLLWKASMRRLAALKSKVPSGNWVVVRYEDMVSDPEDTMRRVCRIVEEDFDLQMLDVSESNSSTGQQQKGIFVSSVRRWRTELSPVEISVAQHLTAQEMRGLGYQREVLKASLPGIAASYGSAPFALFRAIRANADMHGPLLAYLARRVKSLLMG